MAAAFLWLGCNSRRLGMAEILRQARKERDIPTFSPDWCEVMQKAYEQVCMGGQACTRTFVDENGVTHMEHVPYLDLKANEAQA